MKKRRRKNKNKKYVRPALLIPSIILIIIFSTTLGLLEIYQYLNKSSHLKIKKIIVNGSEDNLERWVINSLKLQPTYTNIIFFNADEIKKKIEMHPWIKSVQIKKRYPDTIIINVRKEMPYAMLSIENDLFYIDLQGKMFKKVEYGKYIDLPIITGLNTNSSNFQKRLKKAIEILQIFKRISRHAQEISEIHITKYGNVHLYFCNKGIEVTLSHNIDNIGKKEVLKKFQRLKKVLNYFSNYAQIRFVFIDLDSIKNGVVVSLSK